MSKINQVINPQGFEIVRNRIGEILADEIATQFLLSYDELFESVKVWIERNNPFDKTELPAINVSLNAGDYSNKDLSGSIDGNYTFNVDVYVNAKTTTSSDGDKTANFKLQKLLGISRAILEDQAYKTLGFTPPFISRTFIEQLRIAEISAKEDGLNTVMGRLIFHVVLNESTKLLIPNLISGYITNLKLYETDQGFVYQG